MSVLLKLWATGGANEHFVQPINTDSRELLLSFVPSVSETYRRGSKDRRHDCFGSPSRKREFGVRYNGAEFADAAERGQFWIDAGTGEQTRMRLPGHTGF
jgi:hypothetical protein